MEKIQTGFRILYRLIVFFVLFFGFFITTSWIRLRWRNPYDRIRHFAKNATFFTGSLCRLYNVKINVKNLPPQEANGLIVGNHMGFIDILVVNSLMPSLFVTSVEMKQTPLLGFLCEMGGCVFVERRSRSNLKQELESLIDHLQRGFRVTLYPEATSHNGEEILPFKRTLLTSATYASVPIRPYCFNFLSVNGEPFTTKYQNSVCWYGDISFIEAMLGFLSLKEIVVEVDFLEPYYPKPEEDRAAVADRIREIIVQKFRPIIKSTEKVYFPSQDETAQRTDS